jgi:hypothetical protein
MREHKPPELEMTIDGQFTTRSDQVGLPVKVAVVAIAVAMIAAGLAIAALAIWFALLLIPVALAAGVVGWGALRFQAWRARREIGRARDLHVR